MDSISNTYSNFKVFEIGVMSSQELYLKYTDRKGGEGGGGEESLYRMACF